MRTRVSGDEEVRKQRSMKLKKSEARSQKEEQFGKVEKAVLSSQFCVFRLRQRASAKRVTRGSEPAELESKKR